jgi:transcriptional regulator with XRE-family HTH domain
LPELTDWQLGRRIEVLRTVRGWRQRDLGQASGISRSRICMIEAGGPSTVRSMRQIAAAFGITLSSLLDTNLPVLTFEPKPPRIGSAQKSA